MIDDIQSSFPDFIPGEGKQRNLEALLPGEDVRYEADGLRPTCWFGKQLGLGPGPRPAAENNVRLTTNENPPGRATRCY